MGQSSGLPVCYRIMMQLLVERGGAAGFAEAVSLCMQGHKQGMLSHYTHPLDCNSSADASAGSCKAGSSLLASGQEIDSADSGIDGLVCVDVSDCGPYEALVVLTAWMMTLWHLDR